MSIVINIQNTTIFEPVILMGFYTSLEYKDISDGVLYPWYWQSVLKNNVILDRNLAGPTAQKIGLARPVLQ